jgi:hypothetical protein
MDESDIEDIEKLEELKETPMDDGEIKSILPNVKIIKYSELKNYNNINQLLPKVKDHIIILFENSPNNGHWTALLRPHKNEIEFFDSYGNNDVDILNWIPKRDNINLGVSEPYLRNLLKKSGYKCYYNTTQYQSKNSDIASCGRHCAFRIKCMLKGNQNLKDYHNFMNNLKKKTGLSFDDIVSGVINK